MKRLERFAVMLVVAHSVAVGLVLLLLPQWAMRFGGWDPPPPCFFPCQAGVFHLLLAAGYWLEYRRLGSVVLLVAAKAAATVFLAMVFLLGERAWVVPLAALGDAALGAVVFALHAMQKRMTHMAG